MDMSVKKCADGRLVYLHKYLYCFFFYIQSNDDKITINLSRNLMLVNDSLDACYKVSFLQFNLKLNA